MPPYKVQYKNALGGSSTSQTVSISPTYSNILLVVAVTNFTGQVIKNTVSLSSGANSFSVGAGAGPAQVGSLNLACQSWVVCNYPGIVTSLTVSQASGGTATVYDVHVFEFGDNDFTGSYF